MGQPLMHARHGAGRKIKPIAELGQDQRLKPHIIRNHALSAPGQMADQGNQASKGARMGFAFRQRIGGDRAGGRQQRQRQRFIHGECRRRMHQFTTEAPQLIGKPGDPARLDQIARQP